MNTIEHAQRVQKARADAQVRRASAWAAVPETVLGIPLRPITPASATLLLGIRSAFLCGLPPIEADVKNFIRYHSFDFRTEDPTPRFWSRFKISLRSDRALCPWRTPKKRQAAVRATNFLQAVHEIRAIIEETWADALPLTDDEPLPSASLIMATMQAQLIHSFAREYSYWPLPQPLEHTPLRQLFQLMRCSDRRYFDRQEAALDRQLLEDLNPGAN